MKHEHQDIHTFSFTKDDIEEWAKAQVLRVMGDRVAREKYRPVVDWEPSQQGVSGEAPGDQEVMNITVLLSNGAGKVEDQPKEEMLPKLEAALRAAGRASRKEKGDD